MFSSLTATTAAALPVLLVWAGAADLVTRSIPNGLVLLLAASFGVFAIMTGMPAGQVLAHASCACAVLACGFVLFSRSLIGGGDAKLLAAAALWFGFDHLLPLLAGTGLAGGVLSLAYLAANALHSHLDVASERVTTIPYGAAIAAGALAALPGWLASL